MYNDNTYTNNLDAGALARFILTYKSCSFYTETHSVMYSQTWIQNNAYTDWVSEMYSLNEFYSLSLYSCRFLVNLQRFVFWANPSHFRYCSVYISVHIHWIQCEFCVLCIFLVRALRGTWSFSSSSSSTHPLHFTSIEHGAIKQNAIHLYFILVVDVDMDISKTVYTKRYVMYIPFYIQ